MNRLYSLCMLFGGTICVFQFLLGLVGFGEHHDTGGHGFDVDHDLSTDTEHAAGDHHAGSADGSDSAHGGADDSLTSRFIGVLSFRTIIAGMTFFGLGGLAAEAQGAHPVGSLAVALLAGGAALYVVAWTMRSLSRLRADGTVRIRNAVGQSGVVYLTIPGRRAGRGKVTITLQNRTMEYEALTEQSELPTGATVRVVAVIDPETLAVEAAPEPES